MMEIDNIMTDLAAILRKRGYAVTAPEATEPTPLDTITPLILATIEDFTGWIRTVNLHPKESGRTSRMLSTLRIVGWEVLPAPPLRPGEARKYMELTDIPFVMAARLILSKKTMKWRNVGAVTQLDLETACKAYVRHITSVS